MSVSESLSELSVVWSDSDLAQLGKVVAGYLALDSRRGRRTPETCVSGLAGVEATTSEPLMRGVPTSSCMPAGLESRPRHA